tara:strand:- start:201 stop:707 length:507 start_codon:yes stop_codon:yes gene_type:complete
MNNKLFGYEADPKLFYQEYAKDTGDTDLQVEKYICADDPRMNYTFIKPENIETQKPKLPEVIARDLFDYGVVIKKGEEEDKDNVGTLDTIVPISYAQIKNPQQGEEWYRAKYPDLPEEFYGIIARYTWGAPFTKKEIKNTTKKIKKKNKKEVPQGFSMVKGKFELDFD